MINESNHREALLVYSLKGGLSNRCDIVVTGRYLALNPLQSYVGAVLWAWSICGGERSSLRSEVLAPQPKSWD